MAEQKDKRKLSDMMQHYVALDKELKQKYTDQTILLYRLGDFFEMFFDNAIIASKILELTLTGRDCGLENRAPMCGVPHHAVDGYINRLVSAGYNVAICEQLTKPGEQKGLLKRDVVRIITPGTNTNDEMLDGTQNHYLAGVSHIKDDYAVALLDITTGEFNVKKFADADYAEVEDYLLSNMPSQIIANAEICAQSKFTPAVMNERLVKFTPYYDYSFDFDNAQNSLKKHFNVYSLDALGLSDNAVAASAAGAVIEYVINTQKKDLAHINKLKIIGDNDVMYIDYNTRKNLELTESQSDGKKIGSLLWILDKTKTGMGARLLRNWLLHPLNNIEEIEKRQQAVGEMAKSAATRGKIAALLSQVRDIEKLVTKISYGTIAPRECISLANSLRVIPDVKKILQNMKSELISTLNDSLIPLDDIVKLIDEAIKEDGPANYKEGGYIRNGYSEELDKQRSLKEGGTSMVAKFEAEQRILTGVPSLKVRYNKVFGYYIEISNSKRPETLPAGYIRKQTIASGERYANNELMQLERDILGASERILQIEENILSDIRGVLSEHTPEIQKIAQIIAIIDAVYSLADVAATNNYVKPKFIKNSSVLNIVDGRHPVVETLLKRNEYVANDTTMDKDASMMIITGPNMAGKSTYIRQVALLTLMAHIGSFVPAAKMELGLIDRIFTRVGASDNLMRGQSTFMVEMLEVANIINNATSKSLIILDEIGRGTSTLDGLSIAWAIVENIVLKIKAKTLFATHYHELSELENVLSNIRNYRILINETESGIVFLYKIARGGANKSFGIEVAEIAGVNKEITARARKILSQLSQKQELGGSTVSKLSGSTANKDDVIVTGEQFSMFPEDERFTELKKILAATDVNRCTPIEALTILSDLKKIMEK